MPEEDLAFRIQLGIILPKMKEKIAPDFSAIVEELANIIQAGAREGDEFDMEPVKDIIMKDLEILLDDHILPPIEQKFTPKEEEAPAEEEEEAAEEAAEEEEE